MHPLIAIVGRPNVGKSTFFNRLIGRREAIVDSISGVTRDRNYGLCEWNGNRFFIIDTGGYIIGSDDKFEKKILEQVNLAINEAEIILFMVDIKIGLVDKDYQVANFLRKFQKKNFFLVINKVDGNKELYQAVEFYALGFDKYYCLSSADGSGIGELLDDLVKILPKKNQQNPVSKILPRLAIVGRPNVGKSTILNTLLGEERHVVTNISGTTRDAIEVPYHLFGLKCILIDTAGLRKKSSINENIEFYSVMRSVRAIEYSDVCLLIIDAQRGWQSQDMNIFRLIKKNRKGVVILVNKWDLIKKDTNTFNKYVQSIREKILPFNDVSISFISAFSKIRLLKTLGIAMQVVENRMRKIKTSILNEFMLPIIQTTPPPTITGGKYIKIKYCIQLPTCTPQFAFFSSNSNNIKESYKRFLENKLRKKFSLRGVPITIYFREK